MFNPIGYRHGEIGAYTGGDRRLASIAWRALDYEYREIGNTHILADLAKFLGVPANSWPAVIGEFKKRYGETKGIWLTRTRAAGKEYYGEYGETEKVPYGKTDVILDMGDEVYVFDRRNPTRRPQDGQDGVFLGPGDRTFINKVLMPYFGIKRLKIGWSDSKKAWPDLWCVTGAVPRIVVTREWQQQPVAERRKRLCHEFLHFSGKEHGTHEGLPYSTYPSQDLYSKKVYEKIMKSSNYVQRNPIEGGTTAIARNIPPEPLTWLKNRGYLKGRALDYGSGRSCWYGMECYDPYWKPQKPAGKFDTIVCIYVLNVVSPSVQSRIISNILSMLEPKGKAYFVVRRDIPKSGARGRGVLQRYVELPFHSINKSGTREIYETSKSVACNPLMQPPPSSVTKHFNFHDEGDQIGFFYRKDGSIPGLEDLYGGFNKRLKILHLEWIKTKEGEQRKGTGRSAVNIVLQLARDLGAKRIMGYAARGSEGFWNKMNLEVIPQSHQRARVSKTLNPRET